MTPFTNFTKKLSHLDESMLLPNTISHCKKKHHFIQNEKTSKLGPTKVNCGAFPGYLKASPYHLRPIFTNFRKNANNKRIYPIQLFSTPRSIGECVWIKDNNARCPHNSQHKQNVVQCHRQKKSDGWRPPYNFHHSKSDLPTSYENTFIPIFTQPRGFEPFYNYRHADAYPFAKNSFSFLRNVNREETIANNVGPSKLLVSKRKRRANLYNPYSKYLLGVPNYQYPPMQHIPLWNCYYYPRFKTPDPSAQVVSDYFTKELAHKACGHEIGQFETATNFNKRAFVGNHENLSTTNVDFDYELIDPIDIDSYIFEDDKQTEEITKCNTPETVGVGGRKPLDNLKTTRKHLRKSRPSVKKTTKKANGGRKNHKTYTGVIYDVKTLDNIIEAAASHREGIGRQGFIKNINYSSGTTLNTPLKKSSSSRRRSPTKTTSTIFFTTKKQPNQHIKKTETKKVFNVPLSTVSTVQEPLKSGCEAKYKTKCICSMVSLSIALDQLVQSTKDKNILLNKIKSFTCTSFVPAVQQYEISPNLKPRLITKKKKELQVGTPSGPKEIVTETLEILINRDGPVGGESYYAFPSTTVEMPCMLSPDVKLSTNMADTVKYQWTHSNKKAITEGRMEEDFKHKGTLIINGVTLSDGDNYTCTAFYTDPDTGNKTKQTFIHSVSVVDLPIVALHTNIHYVPNVTCDPEILEMFEYYLPQQIENVVCDTRNDPPSCNTEIFNPVCRKKLKQNDQLGTSILKNLGILFNKSTSPNDIEDMVLSLNHQVELLNLWPSIPSTIDTVKCGPHCRQKILFKIIEILRQSTLDAIVIPVFTVRSQLGKFQPDLASINVKIVVACKGGLYLLEGFCVPCPAGMYSVERSTQCLQCPPSTYQDQVASKSCVPCPHIFRHGCFNKRTFAIYYFPTIAITGLVIAVIIFHFTKKKGTPRSKRKVKKKNKGGKKVLLVKKKGGRLKAVIDEGLEGKSTPAKGSPAFLENSSSDDVWDKRGNTVNERWKPTPVAMDIASDKDNPDEKP